MAHEVLLWHRDGQRVWRTPAGGGLTLALAPGQSLDAALSAALGPVWLLHDGGHLFGQSGLIQVQALEERHPTGGGGWSRDLPPPLPGTRPWQQPGWPDRATRLADHLLRGAGRERQGPLRLHFASDLTATHALETDQGPAWLKVSGTGQEARLTTHLAARHPGLLPPLLGADPGQGALLSADGGPLLDGVADLGAWTGALARLGTFQRVADPAALAALGAPALPLAQTVARVDALLGDAAVLRGWGVDPAVAETLAAARPRIRAAYADLQTHGLPDQPAHGDAHPRNALHSVAHGAVWFDWSEAASAAHPFMDAGWFLAFALHPGRAGLPVWQASGAADRLAAAYLHALGAPEATPLLWRALPLALLHRAAVYDETFRCWQGTVPGVRPNYVPYYLRLAAQSLGRLKAGTT
ncbi:hypothetical protein [Deinococcus aquaedulcis]|uniref:hypothetical protein n=1 Tax=Deinococcus aquaedulcis TaxID=2840455 RepID=UPI001C82F320|nr:hypothetical protein [Deinococcus aquaedulcis]